MSPQTDLDGYPELPTCVFYGQAGVPILHLADDDLETVAALVDTDARPIAQLLWHHIGAASFAGLDPFTLDRKENSRTFLPEPDTTTTHRK